ncbi:MAG: hypothetical protein ACT4PW_12735 [Acidimicrobiia bacterium]
MSSRVVTGLGPDGRLLAMKRARSAADEYRLAHEAEVLRGAGHPGVVEVVDCDRDESGTVQLVTVFAGPHSLDTAAPLTLGRAAGVMSALTDILADLHDAGLCHGRLDPTHVLFGPGGRPVLCGLGGGGPAGSIPPGNPPVLPDCCDPAAPPGSPLTPATDVFALGALLRMVVEEAVPSPGRRRWLALARGPSPGRQRRALLEIAAGAMDDQVTRRPSARRLAAAIGEAAPTARLGDDGPPVAPTAARSRRPHPAGGASASSPGGDRSGAQRPEMNDADRRSGRSVGSAPGPWAGAWLAGRPRAAALVVASVALMAVGYFGLRPGRPGYPAVTAPVGTPGPVSPEASAAAPCEAAVDGPAADVDGDGCAEPVVVGPGGLITAGAARFSVGEPGDAATIGDWDCDGVPTPALLRPGTGEVFRFDSWASPAGDLTARAVAVVPGAVLLVTAPSGACGPPQAQLPDGSLVAAP